MDKQEDIKAFFVSAVEENTNSLYMTARRLTGKDADAEDLVAEAVTKAWSSINMLKDMGRFRAWLFRIMHNCFISHYRKKSIRPIESSYDENATANNEDDIASLLIEQSDDFLSWWANPELEFVNSLLGRDIMTAIESLPEAFRITVLLVNVEGFSYDEAAEILNLPQGTVRSRMKRGRTLLQKALWQHANDAGLVNTSFPKECI